MYHNKPLEEHCEIHKIIKAIFQLYYFSHMQEKVTRYMNKYNLCHKIKLSRHKPYEEIRQTSTLN